MTSLAHILSQLGLLTVLRRYSRPQPCGIGLGWRLTTRVIEHRHTHNLAFNAKDPLNLNPPLAPQGQIPAHQSRP